MEETLRRLETYEGALNAFVLYYLYSAMAVAREIEAAGGAQASRRGCSMAFRSP